MQGSIEAVEGAPARARAVQQVQARGVEDLLEAVSHDRRPPGGDVLNCEGRCRSRHQAHARRIEGAPGRRAKVAQLLPCLVRPCQALSIEECHRRWAQPRIACLLVEAIERWQLVQAARAQERTHLAADGDVLHA